MKASVKLPVFILACVFSLTLCTPTCKAKPSPEEEAREQWRQRWTSTSAAADAGTTPEVQDAASPVVAATSGEASPVADEAKSSHERALEDAKSAAEEALVKEASDADETTTAVDEAAVVEVPAKEEEPASEKSKSSTDEESSTDETSASSTKSSTDETSASSSKSSTDETSASSTKSSTDETSASSTKSESPEGSVVLPGDVASSAFSSAFSHSEHSDSDGEYVSCTAAGGTPSNMKTLRFCYFQDDTVEICACPLKIFNDFELELDDIYDAKYSHYFEDDACYFKKKSQ